MLDDSDEDHGAENVGYSQDNYRRRLVGVKNYNLESTDLLTHSQGN